MFLEVFDLRLVKSLMENDGRSSHHCLLRDLVYARSHIMAKSYFFLLLNPFAKVNLHYRYSLIFCLECQEYSADHEFPDDRICHCTCLIAELYDPKTDYFTPFPHPCASITEMSLVAVNNKVYCIGGLSQPDHYWLDGCPTSNCATDEVWEFSNDNWKQITALPEQLVSPAAVEYGNEVYAFGGATGREYPGFQASQHCYMLSNNNWEKLETMIVDRYEAAALVYHD